jgi:hypothetical protein
MRIYGYEAEPLTWQSAMGLLAVDFTVPLWRQSGVPRATCEQASTLQGIIRPLRIAMIDLSIEGGQRELRQRESGGVDDVREWYDAEAERIGRAGFAAVEQAFGLTDARDLAGWMIATEPGVDPYEAGSAWTHAFTLIAQDRPSSPFVKQHVPKRALPAIRAAFGDGSSVALDQVEHQLETQGMSDEDQAILAWDPATVDPGWPPLRDAVGEFGLYARHVRARALAEVISYLVPQDEWDAFERVARDWPY